MTSDIDELLIGQLVHSEESLTGSIGPIVTSIASAGRLEEFRAAADNYCRQRQRDVGEVCDSNYRSFFRCASWQQTFKLEIDKMAGKVEELRGRLSEAGETVLLKRATRLELLETQLNLEHCIEACESSLRAFNLAQMAALHILDKRFEDSLRQLDALTQQIKAIDEFPFAQQLKLWIPVQVARIKEFAVEELNGWAGMAADKAEAVGSLGLSKVSKLFEAFQRDSVVAIADGASSLLPFEIYLQERLGDRELFLDSEAKQLQISFDRLLKSHHLFDLMDRVDEFRGLFVQHHKSLFDALLAGMAGMAASCGNVAAEDIVRHIQTFVGLCIIQKYAQTMAPAVGGVDFQATLSLFSRHLQKCVATAREQGRCGAKELMVVKEHLCWLLYSLKLLTDPSVSHFAELTRLCLDIFYGYLEIVQSEYSARLVQLVHEDSSSSELVLALLARFIDDYFGCLACIPADVSDLYDIGKQVLTNDLIGRCVLETIAEGASIGKLRLVDELVRGLPGLQSSLALQAMFLRQGHSHRLSISRRVAQCREQLESSLIAKAKEEIDGVFASNARLERMPSGRVSVAGPLFKELIGCFENIDAHYWGELGVEEAQTLKHSTCRHINGKLMDLLSVAEYNRTFLECFKEEVFVLVQYLSKLNGKYADDFLEVSQTLALLTSDNVQAILDPVARSVDYPAVQAHRLVGALKRFAAGGASQRAHDELILLLS